MSIRSKIDQALANDEAAAWTVRATKKGDLDVALEKRPLGKEVTLIRRVEGKPEELLATLRRKFGVGGTSYGSTVEIQGPHVERVRAFLLRGPNAATRLKGVHKKVLEAAAPLSVTRAEYEKVAAELFERALMPVRQARPALLAPHARPPSGTHTTSGTHAR